VTFRDERLELIFTCCRAALAPESHDQVDLELVGGREDRAGDVLLVGDRDPRAE
jgi:predicted RNA polymerase sigma factor